MMTTFLVSLYCTIYISKFGIHKIENNNGEYVKEQTTAEGHQCRYTDSSFFSNNDIIHFVCYAISTSVLIVYRM